MVERKLAYILSAILLFFPLLARADGGVNVVDDYTYEKVVENIGVSDADIANYKELFEAIDHDKYWKAQVLSKKIENDILMGHVLAEQYLSKKYVSKYAELKEWLKKYSNLPQAGKIYKLAVKKGGGKNVPNPQQKQSRKVFPVVNAETFAKISVSGNNKNYVLNSISMFKRYIARGKSKSARLVLEDKKLKRVISPKNYDILSGVLSTQYFVDNQDKLAISWAEPAALRSHNATAAWIAGLAHFRQKEYAEAAKFFGILGGLQDDDWLVAAGAFWAHRSFECIGNFAESKRWLKVAAQYVHTFYGILAAYKAGEPASYNWNIFSYINDFSKPDYVEDILRINAVKRAVLLVKVGKPDLAGAELRREYRHLNDKQREIVLFMAAQFKMYDLAIHISKILQDKHKDLFYDALAYPIIHWMPKRGWKNEQAMVMALARQESVFAPQAISVRGARGLMQLLPSTAAHVSNNAKFRKNKDLLLEPEKNLEVGQMYMHYLLDKPYINGNLFFMLTAYNGGPGNLLKWQKKMQFDNDALMFIETIPSKETRIYIERVMANYWIYNFRMNKQSPSLEQLSQDKWPTL